MAATTTSSGDPLANSRFYSFPPSYTLQPILATRLSQFRSWSKLIQRYCAYHKLWRLSIVEALSSPLFKNPQLRAKGLTRAEVKEILNWMADEVGGMRAEWTDKSEAAAWIYWRRPEEWADVIAGWVDETGQKGAVLTLYELSQGEATAKQGKLFTT